MVQRPHQAALQHPRIYIGAVVTTVRRRAVTVSEQLSVWLEVQFFTKIIGPVVNKVRGLIFTKIREPIVTKVRGLIFTKIKGLVVLRFLVDL